MDTYGYIVSLTPEHTLRWYPDIIHQILSLQELPDFLFGPLATMQYSSY